MSRDTQLATVRHQVSVLAEQVFSLVDEISRQSETGPDASATRNKLDVRETLMWKLRAQQTRLKSQLH